MRYYSQTFFTPPMIENAAPLHASVVQGRSSTAAKIENFENMEDGWYFGMGHPPSRKVVEAALSYLRTVLSYGFSETDAFPGADGEIMVTAYFGDHCIEITVDSDMTLTVAYQAGKKTEFHEPGLSGIEACSELARLVDIIRQRECASLESYISNTTTIQGAVYLPISPLGLSAMEYPSFPNPAGWPPAVPYAPTSRNITVRLPEHLQLSGYLNNPYWMKSAV